MIKQLLSIFAVTLVVSANAQSNRVQTSVFAIEPEISKSITYKVSAGAGCDTISTAQNSSLTINTAGSDTATPGCSPKAGYVFGSNCYGDLEKANFFPAMLYTSVITPSISEVIVGFYRNSNAPIKGTQGGALVPVGMKIYNPTSAAGGVPTTIVTQTTAPMALVTLASSTVSNICYFTFTLTPTPVSASNGFYASVVVPTTAGDTAVVFNSPASTIDYGYELWSNMSWVSISGAWGTALKGNMSIYPVVCGATSGIAKSGIDKNVSLMPNPSTGLVNVLLRFGNAENVSVSVTNVIGQEILSSKFDGITTFVAPLDLSSQPNGIYFVTVSNGTDKFVQRLVINK